MKDAERSLKIAQVLEGYIRRKVIKQTVMTTVYGVTRFGARQQIARQLKGKHDDEFGNLLVTLGILCRLAMVLLDSHVAVLS
jgi:DNA-directed RNA polymerase